MTLPTYDILAQEHYVNYSRRFIDEETTTPGLTEHLVQGIMECIREGVATPSVESSIDLGKRYISYSGSISLREELFAEITSSKLEDSLCRAIAVRLTILGLYVSSVETNLSIYGIRFNVTLEV